MSKAKNPSTASRPTPESSSSILPSVEVLGRHMAAVERARAAIDRGEHDAPDDKLADMRQRQRMDFLLERSVTLERLIGTTRPVTLADAAFAANVAAAEAGGLTGSDLTQMGDVERNRRLGMIERVLCAIVPIIATAAGLDVEVMDFASTAAVADHRFAGLEFVA